MSTATVFAQPNLDHIPADDFLGLYMQENSAQGLITGAEEVTLAKAMEIGKFAKEQLADGGFGKASLEPAPTRDALYASPPISSPHYVTYIKQHAH